MQLYKIYIIKRFIKSYIKRYIKGDIYNLRNKRIVLNVLDSLNNVKYFSNVVIDGQFFHSKVEIIHYLEVSYERFIPYHVIKDILYRLDKLTMLSIVSNQSLYTTLYS